MGDRVGHYIFLSHASSDRRQAESIRTGLQAKDLVVWMAPDDILPGASYSESIMDAINSSTAMVVILSAAANASPHVLREVERAVDRGVPILPVRIESFTLSLGMEYLLSTCQWLDATSDCFTNTLPSKVGSILTQWISNGTLCGGSPAQAGQDLEVIITTASAFDLDVGAVIVSRGTLDKVCNENINSYTEVCRRVGGVGLIEAILANKQESRRVFLYPEKVSKSPDQESLRIAVLNFLISLQMSKITRVAVVPTGRVLGVPRIIALRATLHAYMDYFEHQRTITEATVHTLIFPVPELREASYELGLLCRELRKTFLPQPESGSHYASVAEEWFDDPKSLRVTFTKKP